jgi:uncharacterized protein
MLEIKPICENCGKKLPNESKEAMICTFECTFCKECVENILFNVCPNCCGGFERRPTRPANLLSKNPVSIIENLKPIDTLKFSENLKQYKNIEPERR